MSSTRKGLAFYCFSPPVMMATFTVEICLALYAVWRYRLTVVGRLIVATLFFLALFQLCEYQVCVGWGLEARAWSRLGYVAITTLPPIGLHLLFAAAKKQSRKLIAGAYVVMIGFVGYFLLIPSAFRGYVCTGNYVIFQLGDRASYVYSMYYYGLLLLVFGYGLHWLTSKEVRSHFSRAQVLAIRWIMIGYLVFLVPTALANSVNPKTKAGIPSIMCGFAVIYALILAFVIAPKVGTKRSNSPPKRSDSKDA